MSGPSYIEYSYTTSQGVVTGSSQTDVYVDHWANVERDYRRRLTRILGVEAEHPNSVQANHVAQKEVTQKEVVVPKESSRPNEKLKRKVSRVSVDNLSTGLAALKLRESHQRIPSEERARIIMERLEPRYQNRAHASQFYASLQPSVGTLRDRNYGGTGQRMDFKQRLEYLEADEWCLNIVPTSVVCRGCRKTLLLAQAPVKEGATTGIAKEPSSTSYYTSSWVKHRNMCKQIYRQWCENNGLKPSSE